MKQLSLTISLIIITISSIFSIVPQTMTKAAEFKVEYPGAPGTGEFELPAYEEDTERMYTIRIIEEYLQTIYPYTAALISLLAVLMTVYGSFQIITAAGDSAKVTEGKNRITYAIGGLVLLLLASLILYTINPAFFGFEEIT